MIFGIGTDLIEVERIRDKCESDAFLNRVFAKHEIEYCFEKKTGKYESLAARFAAKEALLKALGTGLRGQLCLNEIIIKNDDLGKPYFLFSGTTQNTIDQYGFKHIHLSIAHIKSVSSAYVVIEK